MSDTLRMRAEAHAFRQLVKHFQERPEVQNIDIMNLSGFCRNCLSKWYHAGAVKEGMALTYDEACETVYGMPYGEYKKKHQTPATEEQMALFKKSHALHAKHEKADAAPACCAPAPKPSDVCCQEVPEVHMDVPSTAKVSMSLSVLTVSDRASQGVYEDLSGPEIEKCVRTYAQQTGAFSIDVVAAAIVPDEQKQIEDKLKEWADNTTCNVILTTGGTGLSTRDVTPEATSSVILRPVPGIPETLRREGARYVNLAVLSRAVAGIRNNTLIVNLPGRPKAVKESLNILLPLLPHALSEVTKSS
eukprot:TRINITY_DN181_c1_g1_i1.p1 TRINITY_DN181_c1_g1~~TRINITY_DN181_c1_g1_i1.p1  ORF type:complete len:315 (+),score=82.07 TRINITY_DN181_c1_g1_i1:39-947(+)